MNEDLAIGEPLEASRLFPPMVALGAFLLVWQVAAANDWGHKKDYQLPSPGQTWTTKITGAPLDGLRVTFR